MTTPDNSTKPAFTPGPWERFDDEIVARHTDQHVADVPLEDGVCPTEWQANLHLIAAAPELYEALRAVVTWWDALAQEQHELTVLHQTLESASENWLKPSNVSPFSLDQLKAALAKAEGRS